MLMYFKIRFSGGVKQVTATDGINDVTRIIKEATNSYDLYQLMDFSTEIGEVFKKNAPRPAQTAFAYSFNYSDLVKAMKECSYLRIGFGDMIFKKERMEDDIFKYLMTTNVIDINEKTWTEVKKIITEILKTGKVAHVIRLDNDDLILTY